MKNKIGKDELGMNGIHFENYFLFCFSFCVCGILEGPFISSLKLLLSLSELKKNTKKIFKINRTS